ncbi:MAG: PAS domain S-box protein [Desulfobulbaceae bacterium]|nr:PAS domain S-box protein [Desulfobulbaceae bacterium]
MKRKIVILFFTLFVIFSAGVSTALYMVFQTTASLNSLITLHKVEIIRQELVINVQTVQANLYTTGTIFGKELDVIVDNVMSLRVTVASCGGCHHEPLVARDISKLQELTEQYQEALSYFITSSADGERIARLQTAAADIGDEIIAKSQTMAMAANKTLSRKTALANNKVEMSKKLLICTILLTFFAAVAIAIYLTTSINKPVSELLNATRKIRTGSLGYQSPYRGRDEFKELIESFNDMSSSLKETNEKILRHMARNQTILQSSIDGFLIFAEDGQIIDANPALCTMTGYSKQELLAMKFTDIEVLSPRNNSGNLLEQIRASNSLIFPVEQKTKTGNLLTVEISATFTEIEGLGNFFCFVRDITARKKTEEELQKVQKLESLGILAGGIAHDFNNLLTGILGNIDLALRRLGPDEKVQGWLNNAIKASRRAQELTQQLLTFAKGGAPVKQPVQIRELLDDSIRFILSGSMVKYQAEIPADIWLVEADKGQISQVVQNITLNACQAMPEGGTMKIRAENVVISDGEVMPLPGGKYVKISFADEGQGIEAKHLARIFDPYFTTKQTGTGLGLTICYSIITKHHGLLKTESTLGVGTTFTIYLPALHAVELLINEAGADATLRGSGRILVMDDEEHIREISAEILGHLGYETDQAKDGKEALEKYRLAKDSGTPYAAVIMDLTIPGGMGGKETVAQLLALDPMAKAIVSSGYSYDQIMADPGKYGFAGVVSKPYDMIKMGKTLHRVINS